MRWFQGSWPPGPKNQTGWPRSLKITLVAIFAGITSDGFLITTDRETGKVTGKMSLSQFRKVIDINLTGVFLTVRECVERMVNNGCRGLVCPVSSTGSLGTAGQINYASSKAAMSVMPKVLTAEFFRRGPGRPDPLHGLCGVVQDQSSFWMESPYFFRSE